MDIAGPDSVFTVEFASFGRALEAYHEGLRHGLVTVPARRKVEVGEELAVQLHLAFADLALFARGRVVHVSGLATIVKLDEVPEELHDILAQAPPEFGRVSADVQIDEEDDDALPGPPQEPGGTVRAKPVEPRVGATTDKQLPRLANGSGEDVLPVGAEATMPSHVLEASAVRRPSALEGAETKKDHREQRAEASGGAPDEPDGFPLPGERDVFLPAVVLFDTELAKQDLAGILLRILKQNLTGVLLLDLPEERYWMYTVAGRPVHYLRRPERTEETLDHLVVERKLLDGSVLDRCRWLARASDRPLLSVIMRLGLLEQAALDECRQILVTRITQRLLREQSPGRARFFHMEELGPLFRTTPADVADALFQRALGRFGDLNPSGAGVLVERHAGQRVVLTELGQEVAGRLTLGDGQRLVVDTHLPSGPTLGDVAAAGVLDDLELVKLVLGLQEMGAVELVAAERTERGREKAEQFLRECHKKLGDDLFAFLGCHWTDDATELRAAFNLYLERMDHPFMGALRTPEAKDVKKQVRAKLRQAEKVLFDRASRIEYRRGLISPREHRMASEFFLRKGETALVQGQGPEAERSFLKVLELDIGGPGTDERTRRAEDALRALRNKG